MIRKVLDDRPEPPRLRGPDGPSLRRPPSPRTSSACAFSASTREAPRSARRPRARSRNGPRSSSKARANWRAGASARASSRPRRAGLHERVLGARIARGMPSSSARGRSRGSCRPWRPIMEKGEVYPRSRRRLAAPTRSAESFHAAIARGQEALAFDPEHEGAKATLISLYLARSPRPSCARTRPTPPLRRARAAPRRRESAVAARGRLELETEPPGARVQDPPARRRGRADPRPALAEELGKTPALARPRRRELPPRDRARGSARRPDLAPRAPRREVRRSASRSTPTPRSARASSTSRPGRFSAAASATRSARPASSGSRDGRGSSSPATGRGQDYVRFLADLAIADREAAYARRPRDGMTGLVLRRRRGAPLSPARDRGGDGYRGTRARPSSASRGTTRTPFSSGKAPSTVASTTSPRSSSGRRRRAAATGDRTPGASASTPRSRTSRARASPCPVSLRSTPSRSTARPPACEAARERARVGPGRRRDVERGERAVEDDARRSVARPARDGASHLPRHSAGARRRERRLVPRRRFAAREVANAGERASGLTRPRPCCPAARRPRGVSCAPRRRPLAAPRPRGA